MCVCVCAICTLTSLIHITAVRMTEMTCMYIQSVKKSLLQNEEGYRVSIIDLQALSDAIFFGLGNLGLKMVAMSYEMSLCFGST